ncbi:MAG: tRNA (adenosine(37)-N6)-threonylcarbamoyltransferase complex dimerization subunit type 1 TsaB [Anaerolineales bacterium]
MLLALDTSTRYSGVALYEEGRVLLEYTWQSANYHTEHLAPMVAQALAQVGAPVGALSGVAVALGPGSFTGLRIGLAFAKGLALACHLPVYGISTLAVLAAAQPPDDLPLLTVLQAGRSRYAVQTAAWMDDAWQLQDEPQIFTLPALLAHAAQPCIVCGELHADARQALSANAPLARLRSPAACLRRPAFLAELAWARHNRKQTDDPASLNPIYLHFD